MKKLIPLSLAAVFALTSGFTMAATQTKATAPQATQTKVVKKHHKATHVVKVAPKTKYRRIKKKKKKRGPIMG